MSFICDPACAAAVEDCRNDATETNWVTFKYEGKNQFAVDATGSGGFDEFRATLKDDACTWAFLRLTQGDHESKRSKFVLVQYNGPALGGIAKSRAGVNKPDIEQMVGQHHIFFFAEGPEDMTEAEIMDKLTKSAGANYDLGSNSKGYTGAESSGKVNTSLWNNPNLSPVTPSTVGTGKVWTPKPAPEAPPPATFEKVQAPPKRAPPKPIAQADADCSTTPEKESSKIHADIGNLIHKAEADIHKASPETARETVRASPPFRTGDGGPSKFQCSPACKEAVEDVRNDSTATAWVTFKYLSRNEVDVDTTGTGSFDDLKAALKDDAVTWSFVRIVSGDQESKRAKFVLVQYNGPSVGVMAKSRAGANKPEIMSMVGQHHLFFFADGPDEMKEEEVRDRILKSSGANYDCGSNAKGYETKAANLKASAASAYKEKEALGPSKPVTYFEGALPKTTPCDLSGRPTVAPASGFQSNINEGNLNVKKWQPGGSSSPDPASKKAEEGVDTSPPAEKVAETNQEEKESEAGAAPEEDKEKTPEAAAKEAWDKEKTPEAAAKEAEDEEKKEEEEKAAADAEKKNADEEKEKEEKAAAEAAKKAEEEKAAADAEAAKKEEVENAAKKAEEERAAADAEAAKKEEEEKAAAEAAKKAEEEEAAADAEAAKKEEEKAASEVSKDAAEPPAVPETDKESAPEAEKESAPDAAAADAEEDAKDDAEGGAEDKEEGERGETASAKKKKKKSKK